MFHNIDCVNIEIGNYAAYLFPVLLIDPFIWVQVKDHFTGCMLERFVPCSGEINFEVDDTQHAIEKIRSIYGEMAKEIDETDGLSLAFDDWRFNLRGSNTEPVLRLNVESKGNAGVMEEKTRALSNVTGGISG